MAKKVLVAIADGIEEIEAVTVIDILRRAKAEVTVAAVKNIAVTASRGTNIVADTTIFKCKNFIYDAIVMPGGMPGAEHLRDSKELIEIVIKHIEKGKVIAAICASPAVILAYHHLIDDITATCYPAMIDKLPKPDKTGATVVVNGNFVTSQGPATSMAFAIKIAEVLFGAEQSAQVAKGLLLNIK